MINAAQIREILTIYKKHGWTLRRVLFAENSEKSLIDLNENLFDGVNIERAEIDAAWFSRASGAGRETWEIRHLSKKPFALLEVFEPHVNEEIRRNACRRLEDAIKEKAAPK